MMLPGPIVTLVGMMADLDAKLPVRDRCALAAHPDAVVQDVVAPVVEVVDEHAAQRRCCRSRCPRRCCSSARHGCGRPSRHWPGRPGWHCPRHRCRCSCRRPGSRPSACRASIRCRSRGCRRSRCADRRPIPPITLNEAGPLMSTPCLVFSRCPTPDGMQADQVVVDEIVVGAFVEESHPAAVVARDHVAVGRSHVADLIVGPADQAHPCAAGANAAYHGRWLRTSPPRWCRGSCPPPDCPGRRC